MDGAEKETMIVLLGEILKYVVPLASVFLSYVLGRMQGNKSKKQEQLENEYQQLYAPFFDIFFRYEINKTPFSRMSKRNRKTMVEFLLKNSKFMDESIIVFMPEIVRGYYEISLEPSANSFTDIAICNHHDSVFSEMVKSLLVQASYKSKKLKLPDIGKAVLMRFVQFECSREGVEEKVR